MPVFPAGITGMNTARKALEETTMKPKGLSHVGMATLDLDKTREFYEKVLGFKVVVADRTSANCIFDGPLELSVA